LGSGDAVTRKGAFGTALLLVLAASLLAAAAMEAVDRLWGWWHRDTARRAYSLIEELRPGMARRDVEAALRATGVRVAQRPGGSLAAFIPSSIIDPCEVAFVFREDRLTAMESGLYNSPGPCPDAPVTFQKRTKREGS